MGKKIYPILVLAVAVVLTVCLFGCGINSAGRVTVDFDTMGGGYLSPVKIKDGAMPELPTPVKKGHTFGGWFYDGACTQAVDPTVVPTENTTFFAKWTKVEISVVFLADGQRQYVYVGYGDDLTEDMLPPVPTKEGYSGRWEKTHVQNVTSSFTVNAIYESRVYNVTYYVGDEIFASYSGMTGDAIGHPEEIPSRENGYFYGWYFDRRFREPCENFIEKIEFSDVDLYARIIDLTDMPQYFTYSVENGEATVTGLTNRGKNQTVLVIPETLGGFPVTAVKGNIKSATRLTFAVPSNVKEIGDGAFADVDFTSLRLSEGLEVIGKEAFKGCDFASISIPSTVKKIGDYAFAENVNLSSFRFEENSALEEMGEYVFDGDASLKQLAISDGDNYELDYKTFFGSEIEEYLPVESNKYFVEDGIIFSKRIVEGENTEEEREESVLCEILYLFPIKRGGKYVVKEDVKTIGKGAFAENTVISELEFSSYVAEIEENAFAMCENLAVVNFGYGLKTIGKYAFFASGIKTVELSGGISYIGEGAFAKSKAERLSFPGGATELVISDEAFKECRELTSVALPAGLNKIGTSAFYGCDKMTVLTFAGGSTLKEISDYAFAYCDSLRRIVIPNSVSKIGHYAFCGNVGSTMEPDIPSTVEFIGDYAFKNSHVTSLRINTNVKTSYFGVGAFQNCAYLATLALSRATEFSAIPDYAFYGCSSLGGTGIILYTNIKKIGNFAFYGCTALTSMTFTDGVVTEIGDSCFENCVNLGYGPGGGTGILPRNLTYLGERAFYGCSKLEKISVPTGLAEIKKETFARCTSLVDVAYDADCELHTLGENSFAYCTSLALMPLPSNLRDREEGGAVKNPFYGCSSLISFSILGNEKLYEKNGVIYLRDGDYSVIYLYPTGRTGAFTVGIDVTGIDEYAFYGASLNRVDFETNGWTTGSPAEKVLFTDIGRYAFADSSITEFELSYRVRNVGAMAFENSRLVNLIISDVAVCEGERFTLENGNGIDDNALTIGEYAFRGTNIANLTVAKRVRNIGTGAFSDCAQLKNLVFDKDYSLGGSVLGNDDLYIGNGAFAGDFGLTNLILPSRLASVGEYAFYNCRNMSNIVFEGSDEKKITVGAYAFAGNHYVYTVTLPSNIESLGAGIFSDCSRLWQVVFPTEIETLDIPDYAFYGCYEFTDLVLPAYVGKIGAHAFENSRLAYVFFEDGELPLTIGESAFANSENLKYILLPSRLIAVESSAFRGSGLESMDIADGDTVVFYERAFAETALKTLTVPTRVDMQGEGIFADTAYLENVVFYKTTVSVSAFENSGIHSIEFTSSIEEIADHAFANTKNLGEVVLPIDGDIYIGSAFENSAIVSIIFPSEGINKAIIGDHAFYSAESLSAINIRAQYMEIGAYAFARSGIRTLNLYAETLYSVAEATAAVARNLEEIEVYDGSGKYEIIDGALYETGDTYILIQYPAGRKGAVFILEDIVSEVGPHAFCGNNYLTTLTIPSKDNVVTFREDAFEFVNETLKLHVDERNVQYYEDMGIPVVSLQRDFGGLVLEEITGGKYAVVGYTGKQTEITVSGKITAGGYDFYISTIETSAFLNNTTITEVIIGDGIKFIEEYAFANAVNLRKITLGNNVAMIRGHVFEGCVSLEEVVFRSSLQMILDYAFYGCEKLTSVDLSKTAIQSIGVYAFANCDLFELDLGNYLESIGNNAFEENKNLVSVSLPSTVVAIGDFVFRNCESLVYVTVNSDKVPKLKGKYGFSATPDSLKIFVSTHAEHLYKTDVDWRVYSSKILSFDNISQEEGFENYVLKENADGYTLVYYLGTENEVRIESDVNGKIITETGEYSFNQFVNYVSFTEGVKRIGKNTFRNAVDIIAVRLPDSVETIGDYAFYGTALEDIDVGENCAIRKIGAYAFAECKKLGELTLPDGVQEIGDYAFYDCGLTGMTFLSDASTSMTIGSYAFANNAFTELKFDCFVSSMGDGAFADCKSMQKLYLNYKGSGIAATGSATHVFENCDLLCVYLPNEEKMKEYKATSGWQSVFDRNRLVLSSYISAEGYVINIISGTTEAAIISYVGKATEVVFPSVVNGYTIRRIGREPNNSKDIVNGCVISHEVTKVTIPISVNTISEDAFRGAMGLKEVVCEDNSILTTIGVTAFAYCENLEKVFLPNSLTSIEASAFAYDKSLTTVVIEERSLSDGRSSALDIGSYAFTETGLCEIALPGYLKTINSYAFYKCENLHTVNFREDGKRDTLVLGNFCFAYTALESISLPDNVTTVNAGVFAYCRALRSVYLSRTYSADKMPTVAHANVFYDATGREIIDETSPFIKIYVPADDAYDSYKNAAGWSTKTVVPNLTAEAVGTGELFNYRANTALAGQSGTITAQSTVILTAYLGDKDEIVIPRSLKIGNYVCNVAAIDRYFGNERIKFVSFAEDCLATDVNPYAFAACTALQSVTMSDRITGMGESAFNGCSSLAEVTLSENLTEIPQYAFNECTSLKEITIPSKVTSIGNAAFIRCTSLNRIDIMFSEATQLGISAFLETDPCLMIIVPDGRVDAFRNQWTEYANKIYPLNNRYGDFVLTDVGSGYALLQYNGNAVLDLTDMTVAGKKIVSVADNALPNGTLIIYGDFTLALTADGFDLVEYRGEEELRDVTVLGRKVNV